MCYAWLGLWRWGVMVSLGPTALLMSCSRVKRCSLWNGWLAGQLLWIPGGTEWLQAAAWLNTPEPHRIFWEETKHLISQLVWQLILSKVDKSQQKCFSHWPLLPDICAGVTGSLVPKSGKFPKPHVSMAFFLLVKNFPCCLFFLQTSWLWRAEAIRMTKVISCGVLNVVLTCITTPSYCLAG